jgi:predicted transcriptional regulator of viral defense system
MPSPQHRRRSLVPSGTELETRIAANIRPQPASQRSDRAIEERAALQHGIVTMAQLEALGLSGRAVRHRVAMGRLRRVHRGVYSVERPGMKGRWMAAVLAGGTGAVLSHRSAAALWGVFDDRRPTVEITIPHATGRKRPGIEVHSGTSLSHRDAATVDGIPCTPLARTLLDLAAKVDGRSLTRAIDRAETLREFDLRAVDELLARSRGLRGAGALAAVLEHYRQTVTHSEAEERFLAVATRAGVPMPEVNAWIPLSDGGGYSPDFLWRDQRLIVEVDGRTHHARRGAFLHDRRRDRRLALAGYQTHRYAAEEVFTQPGRVAEELRRLLAAS